jgi:hypothetical protein
VIGDEADRLIDQIRGQMITVGVAAGRIDMGVVGDQFRRVLVGLGVEEAVEAVKPRPSGWTTLDASTPRAAAEAE